MPKRNRDVTHYSRYFNLEAPSSAIQALLFFVIGIVAGLSISLLTHISSSSRLLPFLISGASTGVIMITLPAILTVMFVKAMRFKIKLKHALFAVLVVTLSYAVLMVINAAAFLFLHNYIIAYVILVIINCGIYGYWFIINRIVLGQKRSQTFTAAVHPILNILLFLPVERYLFGVSVPVGQILLKLWAGMLVFMAVGYLILYIMDLPARRELKISGIALITSMVGQWLYDTIKEKEIFGAVGSRRDIDIGILALHGRKGYKAIFVMPDIHYGPFLEIGGSVATERIGGELEKRYGATPFVMHGAVNIEDNPVSSRQIDRISEKIREEIDRLDVRSLKPAVGSIGIAANNPCRAISIGMEDSCLLTLTKAPMTTEDIERGVGLQLKGIAERRFRNVLLIDAHNSRIESAPADELRGVYKGSKYVSHYGNAIESAVSKARQKRTRMRFGSASAKTSDTLVRKDLGKGFTSVGIFDFNGRKFCMVYFDANNMLPSFREGILAHVKERYGMDAEVYTTDTHSVNTIALSVSNVLGRETRLREITPILDSLINGSMKNMEYVKCAYLDCCMKDFRVWGQGCTTR